ncbi:MAG TPA: permease prefix domain 1-containing protein [Phycisphaerae bacterium]|nr:permease prefix domain 1-containing protein [Phycisphaerae bacterium]
MCNNARIENRIADVLVGSGLPADRRSEIVEELREHFEQSIARKRETGLSDEQAVETVLAEFGSPAIIRKQLRRQQRVADRRRAVTEVRRQIWLPFAFSGFFSILSGVLTPETDSLPMRCLGGVTMFIGLFLLMVGFMYAGQIFSYQVQRQRPRKEYHFLKSCLRWIAVVAFGFVALVPMLLLELVACALLLGKIPFANHFPQLLWYNFGVAWLESASRNFGLCTLGILGFGLTLALYERSRCVDEPVTPVAG